MTVIKFDITALPPSQEEIDMRRSELESLPLYRFSPKWLFLFPALVSSLFFAVKSFQFLKLRDDTYGYAAIVSGLFCGAWVLVLVWLEARFNGITLDIESLDEIALSCCPDMVDWCEQDETVRAYQNAVATSGRPLTQGEYEIARIWIESATSDKMAAKEKLLSPIHVSHSMSPIQCKEGNT